MTRPTPLLVLLVQITAVAAGSGMLQASPVDRFFEPPPGERPPWQAEYDQSFDIDPEYPIAFANIVRMFEMGTYRVGSSIAKGLAVLDSLLLGRTLDNGYSSGEAYYVSAEHYFKLVTMLSSVTDLLPDPLDVPYVPHATGLYLTAMDSLSTPRGSL